MKVLLVSILIFVPLAFVSAHVPNLITQDSLLDIEQIVDPELSRAFYGKMTSFPHTYEIVATEPFHLFTQILVPDIESSKNNISGIIIKEPEGGGRVTVIAELNAKDSMWESTYEPFGGDTYREGPVFEGDVEAGTYRIEVHTPDNIEKYVLVVGKREEMSIGYFETIRRLAHVKVFFDKSQFRVVESPFVYVPIIIMVITGLIVQYLRLRQKRTM